MALKLGELEVDITANTAGLKKAEREVSLASKSMTRAMTAVGSAILAAFSARAIAGAIILADEMSVLERRIGVISDNTEQATRNFSRLTAIATRTGQRIRDVSRVFEGFKRIQSDIGATNTELLNFTESLSKLGAIGGSSGDEIRMALRQLNQGLAGGILRAEEFNSIIENTPEIAFAIATGMGKTVGQLRAAVLEGTVLSKDVFDAILSQTDAVAARFEEIPQSLAQVFQGAKNEMAVYIANVNEAIGLTEGLADVFAKFRDNLAQVNKENAELSKTDREEAERRLAVELKSIQHIDSLIKSNKLNVFIQTQLLAKDEDNEKALRLSTIHQSDIIKLTKQRLFFVNRVLKIEERLKEIKDETVREAEHAVDIEEKSALMVERKAAASARNLQLERLTNQERQLAVTGASFLTTPTRGAGGRRFAGAGGADDPLAPQAFGDPDIAGQVSGFLASLGDSNAKIEAETQRHEDALSEITTFSAEQRAQLQDEIDEKMAAAKATNLAAQLSTVGSFLGQINGLMIAAGKEGTDAQRAIAIAQAAIQAQQIWAAGLVAAEKAAAFSAVAGPFAALASKQAILGAAAASAGIVLGLSFGGGRLHGGPVAGNLATPINENGDPEVFVQGGRQFLLPGGKGGRVISGADMETTGKGGGVQVIINNQGPPIEASIQSRSDDRIVLMIRQAEDNAVKRVNASISSNQGPTARALGRAGITRTI